MTDDIEHHDIGYVDGRALEPPTAQRHYRLPSGIVLYRDGWLRWGAWRNGACADNYWTPLGALVGLLRYEEELARG